MADYISHKLGVQIENTMLKCQPPLIKLNVYEFHLDILKPRTFLLKADCWLCW